MFQRHPVQSDVTMLVTTNTKNRLPVFADSGFARKAIDQLYRLQKYHLFFLYAFVVMPDHVHFLLHVRSPSKISNLMNVYKAGLTFELGIGAFWQSRFHVIVPKKPFEVIDYIHQNPVKAGFVSLPEEYPWSSASGRWEVTSLE